MVLRPEVQPEADSITDQSDCIVRVSEAEFVVLIKNLLAAMGRQTTGSA